MLPDPSVRIVVATRPVDFRRGHDALAATAAGELGLDIWSGVIVIFRSKRGDRLKMLAWDGTGLVLTRRRVEPRAKRLIVEIVRQRPGQPRRFRPGKHMRDRPRAHPDRGGDLRLRQRKIVTVPENILDLHHAGPLHRAPAFSIRSSDRSGRVGRESAPRTASSAASRAMAGSG